MKRFALLVGLLCSAAFAQTPEVSVFADLRPTLFVSDGKGSLRFYDFQGRHSLVGLTLWLENGYKIYAAQRLQRISSSSDEDLFDAYYIEDPGHWRLGKQYLPFGQQGLIRDSALALRYNAELLFGGLPLTIAVAEGEKDEVRGTVVRVGPGLWGLSYATGNHFASQGTSLTQLRSPVEVSPGSHGYREMFGADVQFSLAMFTVGGEALLLRDGHSLSDRDMDITDVWVRWNLPGLGYLVEAGWAQEWKENRNSLRASITIPVMRGADAIPYVRLDNGSLKHIGISTRIRF